MDKAYKPNAYGFWRVTTEGDEEGRNTKELGIYEGYLDDIAFELADSVFYALRFEPIVPKRVDYSTSGKYEINVSLGIESGTWNQPKEDRITYFKDMLSPGGKAAVEESNYYACVKLVRDRTKAEREQLRRKSIAESALTKLSTEERLALRATGLL